MLTAVQLDDQFISRGTKVCNVIADGMLWAEVNLTHAMRSQVGMMLALLRRQITA